MMISNNSYIWFLLITLIILLTIIIIFIIKGIKYADNKILVCQKCGKKQAKMFLIKYNNHNRLAKIVCTHCHEKTTFLVEDNLKDTSVPEGWKFLCCSVDGQPVKIFGKTIFNENWVNTGDKVLVYDPSYNEPHYFNVYKIIVNNEEKKFVAGEFSNCIWGFYIQK